MTPLQRASLCELWHGVLFMLWLPLASCSWTASCDVVHPGLPGFSLDMFLDRFGRPAACLL